MCKTLLTLTFLYLINVVQLLKIYYPNRNDPDAIVFEEPTNYYDKQNVAENEVTGDFSGLLDVRAGDAPTEQNLIELDDTTQDYCPPGFKQLGDLCFPND